MRDGSIHDAAFRAKPPPPWAETRGLAEVLATWRSSSAIAQCTVLDQTLQGREARHADYPSTLHENLRRALVARGIARPYCHQVQAFELASAGRDIVVSTPTASGKSLCYHLPVLDALLRDGSTRALYLFPTKALSRDQEESLRALMREAGVGQAAITYDGDTAGDVRRAAREQSGVILTNPDMLHAGILPHHAHWARLFANLRYIVIDELHSYRGVFGSHLANVLRRLLRVARFHGSEPVFLFASATIGNPEEHASRMAGRAVRPVSENGAPSGPRQVLVYNPPVVNAELGLRQSYLKATVRLTYDLVRAGVPTLVFGQGRNHVEMMLKYLRDRLVRDKLDPDIVMSYRGGYLPETRRSIERGLREGQIRCVVATSALELGIDIGSLDAVVCAGYPGSVAGLWQRFGRAGRRREGSLALLVTSSAPVDQYCAQTPTTLVGTAVEQARIDPDNVEILLQHVKCAAFELPFEEDEPFGDVPIDDTRHALGFLHQHGLVHPAQVSGSKRVYHWVSRTFPASGVSLRSVGWDNFVVIELDRQTTLAEMDFRSAHTMLHEQAIYQHEGEPFQVERLDFENHKAFVRKVAPDYFTTAMTHTRVSVLDAEATAPTPACAAPRGAVAGLGEVSVIERVVGYKKVKFHSHENVGYGEVRLPEMQMHTSAFWLMVPEAVVEELPYARASVVDALRGFGHALHTVAAVGLMTDPRDLGTAMGDRTDEDAPPAKRGGAPGFDPTFFLYDHVAGGVGLAPRMFEAREELMRRARKLVFDCGCDLGCPACIGPEIGQGGPGLAPSELGGSGTRKRVIRALLDSLGVLELH